MKGEPLIDRWAMLLLPALMALTLVFILPIVLLASQSFHPSAGLGVVGPEWTLENYRNFVTDPFYLGILLDTLLLGVIVVTVCMIVGYPAAYYLARMRSRWKPVLVFLVVSPLLISVVIRNLGWLPILGNNGLVNWILHVTGVMDDPIQLAGNFTGACIGLIHAWLPIMILTIMTVIQRIELDIEEASINLGASPFQTFWRVLLPLSRPGLLSGYLLVFTVVISAFVTPGMLGGRRVLVMAVYVEQQLRAVLNYATSSTAAVILMITAGALTIIALRPSSKESAVRGT